MRTPPACRWHGVRFSRESGLRPDLKHQILKLVAAGTAEGLHLIRWPRPRISIQGCAKLRAPLPRQCLRGQNAGLRHGYLREPYAMEDGKIRLPLRRRAHRELLAKGGKLEDTVGRKVASAMLCWPTSATLRTASSRKLSPLLSRLADDLALSAHSWHPAAPATAPRTSSIAC